MAGSTVEDLGLPESWEAADLDAALSRLMLSSTPSNDPAQREELPDVQPPSQIQTSGSSSSGEKVLDDAVNQVDQFLREALENPRERLSVLRMEQEVEKFIHDPSQQQMEFQQIPTSYLRLAAHRVAQHYNLQSMVLLDNSLPDGSGSRIIVRKTSECRRPAIRLADIPVNLRSEDSSVIKVAIKQRPQKQSSFVSSSDSDTVKTNKSKSVEERKEEYNRARARIFNSSNPSIGHGGDPEIEHRLYDGSRVSKPSRVEEKFTAGPSDATSSRSLIDSFASGSRTTRSRVEMEATVRSKPNNNRVAIFRDRETELKDPDYDRSYDRYLQRFDPGFGFSNGPYTIQPMFTPAVNYNTEFPQLGSTHRPQIFVEHQARPLPQHLPAPWAGPSNPAGIAYVHPEPMMTPFSPSHMDARPSSTLYLHSSQFPCQHPGMPFIHTHDHVRQPFAQSHQPQSDGSYELARPR
ncbi:PREDICTED: R3H domain-containing protein 2-like [Tarenaya hassleriana]|uniref:R3H domain-containing protein 2-like n=1 Tax=Tarenaya hassleriana TaxID=28532 RepID=UPI00053C9E07|nr:PREDICTED: R3H domain-containing protein 2-like [Tarenaya hassleriana]XP_010555982.1 PREDICTED: R3H domain-containing protein 2-like [Tarenaya hassleriana]